MKIFISISLLMLIVFGCSQETEENIEKAVPIKIYEVKAENISDYIKVNGSVTAEEDVIVYAKVTERIEKIYVKPGQKVSKNQLMAEQKNGILKQGLEIANSSLKTAEAQMKLSAQDFERMKKLHSEKAISQQQFDQAKTSKETIELAFEQAKSSYEQAKEQYNNSLAKAPFNGVVAAVYVEENEMVNMGQRLAQVVSPSKMKAKVYLTGEDVQRVRTGQNTLVKFPTIPGEEFTGKVSKINTSIDQMSKSLEVEIEFTTTDSRLKSGMFGEFLIETQNHENSIVIPETALLTQTEVQINRETGLQKALKKYFIYVIENGKAKLNEVKTGILNDGQVEITNGLNMGDSVIIVGQNIVKEGQTVNVIE